MVTVYFDNDEIDIPTSRFYRLAPMGLGTPLVEGFTSYFERDAAEMSLLPGILASREIVPLLAPSSTYSNGKTPQLTSSWAKTCSSALNGLTDSTREWVRTLEALTLRDDLRFLTMLSWCNVLSWRGLVKRSKAWCSSCFHQAKHEQKPIYIPLLWLLEPVSVCLEHGIRLSTVCPNCQRVLPMMDTRSRPGWCSHCHHWLGTQHVEQAPITYEEWKEQVRTFKWLGEMLAVASTLKKIPQRDIVSRAFSKTIDVMFGGNAKALARTMGMNPRSIYELRDGTQIPQIKTLLKLCTMLNMSLVDLLINQKEFNRSSLSPPTFPTSPISPQNFDRDRAFRVLKAASEDDSWPPRPLKDIIEPLQADQSHLRRHFPELCDVIVEKYRQYQKIRKAYRLQRARELIQTEAKRLHALGIYPSMWQLGKTLSVFILREQEVYDAWQQVLRELGYISTEGYPA